MDEKYESVLGASSPHSVRIFPMLYVRPLEQIRRNRNMYVAVYIVSHPLDNVVGVDETYTFNCLGNSFFRNGTIP